MDRGEIEPRSGERFPDESFAVADPSSETHPHGSRRGLHSYGPTGLRNQLKLTLMRPARVAKVFRRLVRRALV